MIVRFHDRADAGRRLAARLRDAPPSGDVVVIALPRGGVPVGAEVARALHCPLDVLIVRKLGVPGHRELGFGALAEQDIRVLNGSLVRRLAITDRQIDAIAAEESTEVVRRVRAYRQGREMTPVRDRTVVLVDDGVATGFTAIAAVRALRTMGPSRIVVAVPVAAPATVEELRAVAEEVVALETPTNFDAIGRWYEDFSQVPDRAVTEILAEFAAVPDHDPAPTGQGPSASLRSASRELAIDIGATTLPGTLTVPEDATGIVVFAHGSGSSRLSPRNRAVARALNDHGIGTLLFDLLAGDEARSRTNVFDVALLADRLGHARAALAADPAVASLPVGYFGASTGAAAALVAAARADDPVVAIVSRGGRPDLAGQALGEVRAPTMLIVGQNDHDVLRMNREAQRHLRGVSRLAVVPGATHLFEKPGTLAAVTELATDWFAQWFRRASSARRPIGR